MAGLADLSTPGLVAYAPASIGNLAAGFDLLGAALAPLDGSLLGDLVHVDHAKEPSFQITGPFAAALADDTRPNLALRARDLFVEAVRAGGELAVGDGEKISTAAGRVKKRERAQLFVKLKQFVLEPLDLLELGQ